MQEFVMTFFPDEFEKKDKVGEGCMPLAEGDWCLPTDPSQECDTLLCSVIEITLKAKP